jgi:hypothetical protein
MQLRLRSWQLEHAGRPPDAKSTTTSLRLHLTLQSPHEYHTKLPEWQPVHTGACGRLHKQNTAASLYGDHLSSPQPRTRSRYRPHPQSPSGQVDLLVEDREQRESSSGLRRAWRDGQG